MRINFNDPKRRVPTRFRTVSEEEPIFNGPNPGGHNHFYIPDSLDKEGLIEWYVNELLQSFKSDSGFDNIHPLTPNSFLTERDKERFTVSVNVYPGNPREKVIGKKLKKGGSFQKHMIF